MYSNNIVNFQEFTAILSACTKKIWKLIVCTSYMKQRDRKYERGGGGGGGGEREREREVIVVSIEGKVREPSSNFAVRVCKKTEIHFSQCSFKYILKNVTVNIVRNQHLSVKRNNGLFELISCYVGLILFQIENRFCVKNSCRPIRFKVFTLLSQ